MSTPAPGPERRFPPVTEICIASMGLVIAGGIYLAAHLPRVPPLAPAAGLVAAGGVLLLVAIGTLARLRAFAWDRFFLVARYAALAYVVIGGLLAFVFIKDGTHGSVLVLLLATLVIFAVDVPLILAFTVARYATPAPA